MELYSSRNFILLECHTKLSCYFFFIALKICLVLFIILPVACIKCLHAVKIERDKNCPSQVEQDLKPVSKPCVEAHHL